MLENFNEDKRKNTWIKIRVSYWMEYNNKIWECFLMAQDAISI